MNSIVEDHIVTEFVSKTVKALVAFPVEFTCDNKYTVST